jgi:hypothetical protein
MASSLLSDKPLVISPVLAATLGLEEAVMLSVLHEISLHRALHGWVRMAESSLMPLLPFWDDRDIQRISTSLRDKGVIQLRSAPFLSSRELDFSLLEQSEQAAKASAPPAQLPQAASPLGARLMSPQWEPDTELLRQLSQLGIPHDFVVLQVPEFVRYWRERGEAHHAWGNRFLKQVMRNWRDQEQHSAKVALSVPMHPGWQPGQDALHILTRAGVERQFMDDCLPEFVLYWRERGESGSTWDSRFVQHIRRQWAVFTSRLINDSQPRVLPADWQPSQDVYDILQMANIDRDFAAAQIAEFVLYWRDNGQAHSSWNSRFLHHVKYRWARRHQQPWQGDTDGFIEKHTDRSWREGA